MRAIQINGQTRAESFIYRLHDQTTLKSVRDKSTLFTAYRLLSSFEPFHLESLSRLLFSSTPLIGHLDSNDWCLGMEAGNPETNPVT